MKKNNSQLHNGFSLVELIVIMSLFAIMASVATFDFQRYQENIERVNLSTDIALAFRQMQVYGISSSNRTVGGSSFDQDNDAVDNLVNQNLIQDTSVYGVELDIDAQSLVLFQEIGDNANRYDEGIDIVVDRLVINGQNEVMHICAATEGALAQVELDASCSFLPGSGEEITQGVFTALFRRPFPDGMFHFSSEPTLTVSSAVIVVGVPGRPANELNYIYLDAVGLIQGVNANTVITS
jgi:prepilin-type N-terminal cleavage/methylation domain-containing protein